MKIALIGWGKMGQVVERIALEEGDEIVCRITSQSACWDLLEDADIAIDFSSPEVVSEHVMRCARAKKNIVIGTTGWLSELEVVKSFVDRFQIGILYAPNFSIGVHLFLRLLMLSGSLFQSFSEYQAAGQEVHHQHKKDAPSGTALAMRDFLKKGGFRQTEIPISSLRVGSMTGKHTLLFDSLCDTISITHEAKNKEGYAQGALRSARWLIGKQGFYTLDDILQENICT